MNIRLNIDVIELEDLLINFKRDKIVIGFYNNIEAPVIITSKDENDLITIFLIESIIIPPQVYLTVSIIGAKLRILS